MTKKKSKKKNKGKLIVLDIDGTLIDSGVYEQYKYKNEFKHLRKVYKNNLDVVESKNHFNRINLYIARRPFFHQFLQFCKNNFEYVGLWTNGTEDHLNSIYNNAFPKNYPVLFKWAHDRSILPLSEESLPFETPCDVYKKYKKDYMESTYKSLSKIYKQFSNKGINSSNTLMIEDMIDPMEHDLDNLILVNPYNVNYGSNDIDLFLLSIYLQEYIINKSHKNVKNINKQNWMFNIINRLSIDNSLKSQKSLSKQSIYKESKKLKLLVFNINSLFKVIMKSSYDSYTKFSKKYYKNSLHYDKFCYKDMYDREVMGVKRPHINTLFEFILNHVEHVYMSTNNDKSEVDRYIDILLPKNVQSKILFIDYGYTRDYIRNNRPVAILHNAPCKDKHKYVKDLEKFWDRNYETNIFKKYKKLGINKSNTIFLDFIDFPQNSLQLSNRSVTHFMIDFEFLLLSLFLKHFILPSNDIRTIPKLHWKLDIFNKLS